MVVAATSVDNGFMDWVFVVMVNGNISQEPSVCCINVEQTIVIYCSKTISKTILVYYTLIVLMPLGEMDSSVLISSIGGMAVSIKLIITVVNGDVTTVVEAIISLVDCMEQISTVLEQDEHEPKGELQENRIAKGPD